MEELVQSKKNHKSKSTQITAQNCELPGVQSGAQLTSEQLHALNLLRSGDNVFLTGGAGSGKSFLVKQFLKEIDAKQIPILASTGAAAVLIGGRTFHSFFGLGIMDGGSQATFDRCLKDGRLLSRLRKVEGFVLDEVSMISGEALNLAENLAQKARGSSLPWGGLRVVVVGDFAQLPPITKWGSKRDWSFLSQAWQTSEFQIAQLTHNQRVTDNYFLNVLADVRHGKVTSQVTEFLNSAVKFHDEDHPATRLFPRRAQSESFNQKKLSEINEEEVCIDSIYFGNEKQTQQLMNSAPVPQKLILKKGCRVMFLQNDPQKRWINGTRGVVTEIKPDSITVRKEVLKSGSDEGFKFGREVSVEKSSFSIQDADGNVVASVIQFPLNLAYATTIHKSQGATLEDLWCDLSALWEPGHAYVAMSRLRSQSGLNLIKWSPRSIIVDPNVVSFYKKLNIS